MIARICLPAIAVGLWLCGPSAAQAPSPGSSSPSRQSAPIANGNQSQTAGDEKTATPNLPVLNTPKPPQDQERGRDSTNSKDGVGAGQHQRTNSEEQLVNLTFWLVLATIALMTATFGLWWETRKLAAQAKDASQDTKRSIEIAERAADEAARAAQAAVDALAVERAWMSVGETMVKVWDRTPINGVDHGNTVDINIAWINTGRSPALNIRHFLTLKFVQAGVMDAELELKADENGHDNLLAFAIGPQQTIYSKNMRMNGAALADFIEGRREIICHGLVEYNTQFSTDTYYTRIYGKLFCTGTDPDPHGGLDKVHVSLTPFGPKNSIGVVADRPPFGA